MRVFPSVFSRVVAGAVVVSIAFGATVVGMGFGVGVSGCGSGRGQHQRPEQTADAEHEAARPAPKPSPKPSASDGGGSLADAISDAVREEARNPSGRHAALRPFTSIADPDINECSGLTMYQGEYVVHNDSGDRARVFMSSDLDFADPVVLDIPGAHAIDWEEVTTYEGDLLICDIGDNGRRRPHVTLYRVRVADDVDGQPAASLIDTYNYTYPDGPHDAEAALEIDGVLYVVTKDRGDGTHVYRFDELEPSVDGGVVLNVPTQVAVLDLDSHEQVTAATYDPVSNTIALLTYSAIVTYSGARFTGKPDQVHRFWGRQAESICVKDRNLIVINEQRDVFVIPGLLDGFTNASLLPNASILQIPIVTSATAVTGTPVPLHDGEPAESLRLAIDAEWVLIDTRLHISDSFAPMNVDAPSMGSCLLVMFAETDHHRVDARDRQFALGTTADGELGVWRVDLASDDLGLVPVTGARIDGQRRGNSLAITVRLPLTDVFPSGVVPPTFRFDARGIGLREGNQPYFSGNDLFAIYRPYVWGRVNVVH